MLVSVIIPTKGRPDAVVDAVRSVFAGTYQQFELFVIDQSPDEATRDALAPFTSDRRFHYRQNRRPGYGAASSRNIGLALSSGEVIAVIDDDVVVRPDWLARIVAEFERDPELEFIAGRLTAPPYDRDTGYTPEFCPDKGISTWRLVTMVAGANISMRRTLVERIGGYDEFCGPGSRLGASDDTDLTLRVVHGGAKWKGCPEIEVVHVHGFRPKAAGDALAQRYQRGNGGVFGRAMRRGHITPGLWFLLRESRAVVLAAGNLLHGRRPTGFDEVSLRLVGFRDGFRLSPADGFVGGADLARMRRELADTAVANTAGVDAAEMAAR